MLEPFSAICHQQMLPSKYFPNNLITDALNIYHILSNTPRTLSQLTSGPTQSKSPPLSPHRLRTATCPLAFHSCRLISSFPHGRGKISSEKLIRPLHTGKPNHPNTHNTRLPALPTRQMYLFYPVAVIIIASEYPRHIIIVIVYFVLLLLGSEANHSPSAGYYYFNFCNNNIFYHPS